MIRMSQRWGKVYKGVPNECECQWLDFFTDTIFHSFFFNISLTICGLAFP
jgi:hypothetical protein